MKIKSRLGDADADRTEVHQIKSTTFAFDFRRILIVRKDKENTMADVRLYISRHGKTMFNTIGRVQ
ncbi:hypothetical protein, partial [Streptococcus suis]|uniref:hypothetical protein n=1 Tax=Streptococcus suis TaxID=1307 RepID=UPI002AAB4D18